LTFRAVVKFYVTQKKIQEKLYLRQLQKIFSEDADELDLRQVYSNGLSDFV